MRDLLGERTGVGKDDRGAIFTDRAAQPAEQPAIAQATVGRLAGLDQAFNLDLDRGTVATAGPGRLDDATCPPWPDQVSRHDVGRAAGRRQANPAGVTRGLGRHPLERNGQIGPSLGRRQCMHLVDDQVLDPAPVRNPSRLAQEQSEALGRGDQDVWRMVSKLAAMVGRRVAGPHAHSHRARVRHPAGA